MTCIFYSPKQFLIKWGNVDSNPNNMPPIHFYLNDLVKSVLMYVT